MAPMTQSSHFHEGTAMRGANSEDNGTPVNHSGSVPRQANFKLAACWMIVSKFSISSTEAACVDL
jgi:hypothetical protein